VEGKEIMSNEQYRPVCPFNKTECNGSCALYDDSYQCCAIKVISSALTDIQYSKQREIEAMQNGLQVYAKIQKD